MHFIYQKYLLPYRTKNHSIYKKSITEWNTTTSTSGIQLAHHPIAENYRFSYSAKSQTVTYTNLETESCLFDKMTHIYNRIVVNGLSGSTNLMVHLADEISKHHASDNFSTEQAILATIAFVVYDGGHSINEALTVYELIRHLQSDKNDSFSLDNCICDYNALASLAGSEKETVSHILDASWISTLDYFEEHAFSKKENEAIIFH